MSGGIAYVLDESGGFTEHRLNHEMVDVEPVADKEDVAELRDMIEKHHRNTGSPVAKRILDDWEPALKRFIKVMPTDYKIALERLALEAKEEGSTVDKELVAEV